MADFHHGPDALVIAGITLLASTGAAQRAVEFTAPLRFELGRGSPTSLTAGSLPDQGAFTAVGAGDHLIVFRSDGTGWLTPWVELDTPDAPQVVAGDLDEDGLQDLTVVSGGDRGVVIFFGSEPDGSFSNQGNFAFVGLILDFWESQFSRFVARIGERPPTVWVGGRGSSWGSFIEPFFALPHVQDGPELETDAVDDLAITDLDEDGSRDIVVLQRSLSRMLVHWGRPDECEAPDWCLETGEIPVIGHPETVLAEDLDRDGHVDLLLVSPDAPEVTIRRGTGTREPGDAVVAEGRGPFADPLVLDLNGDGAPDLAGLDPVAGLVRVLPGDGLGGFGPVVAFDAGPLPRHVATADLDGDPAPDLVVAGEGGDLALLFNQTPDPNRVRVSPDRGGDTGPVTVRLIRDRGHAFDAGTAVALERAEHAPVRGVISRPDPNPGVLTATFDLAGQARGPWDVVVTGPEGQPRVLREAFNIEAGAGSTLRVDLLGRGIHRPGRPHTMLLTYENTGNNDMTGALVLLDLGGLPPDTTIRPGFDFVVPGAEDGADLPIVELEGRPLLPVLIPPVPAGGAGVLLFELTTATAEPMEVRALLIQR